MKKEVKHLLIVTPGFPADEQEANCLPYLQQFILSYKKQYPELRLTVLSLHYPFHRAVYQWNGIDVYCMQGRNKKGIRRAATIYKAYKAGVGIHKKNAVDAILSIWITDASLAAKYISKRYNLPHFIWSWGQDVKSGNKYVKLVNPTPEHLAVMSAYQNNVLYQSYGIRASYVIPNGIAEEEFPELNDGKRSIDLLAVGSLIPLKQYHLFIELVKWLNDNGHGSIKAVLAGNGELMPELRKMVANYKLEDNIHLKGEVPHSDVYDLMNNSKLFIHPSSYEGHSTVMLEALYSGCKVVGFIPAADTEIENFTLCIDFEEMKKITAELLKASKAAKRVSYSTWPQNVEKIQHIITSMLS